jgi:presenilin-like A22 family membrane protease
LQFDALQAHRHRRLIKQANQAANMPKPLLLVLPRQCKMQIWVEIVSLSINSEEFV